MINIQELERSEQFFAVIPKRGAYKQRVPQVIEEFDNQLFAGIHIAAVLKDELKIKTDFDSLDKHKRNIAYWLRELEEQGKIEKTDKKTLDKNALYRRLK